MEFVVETMSALGTLLIAWAALAVHHRVLNEHSISENVTHVMRTEQAFGILGIVLVFVSYILRVIYIV